MPPLRDYRRKRDPAKTPEPFEDGKRAPSSGAGLRRPAPRRTATPLRLPPRAQRGARELGGPEGRAARARSRRCWRSTSRITRSSYGDFEGEIPQGNYGAGTVEIWDRGTYELVEEKRNGGLTVRLHGEKLEGLWALVPAKLSGDPKNWLLVRKREQERESVSATQSRPRQRYAPMLATPADSVPAGQGWLFEVKWDGYRAIATMRGGRDRAPQPQRQLAERALSDGRARPRAGPAHARLRPRRRGGARSAPTAARPSPRCSRGRMGRATSTSPSTCSRSRASR